MFLHPSFGRCSSVAAMAPGAGVAAPLDGLTGITSAFSASRVLLSTFSGAKYTLTSGAVSSWTDQTSNGFHLTQGTGAARPIIEAAGPNGRDAISFDGTDDFLEGSALSAYIDSNNGYVIFSLVIDAVTTNDAAYINNDPTFTDRGNFVGFSLRNNAGTYTAAAYNWDANEDKPTVFSVSLATAYVFEWSHESGLVIGRVNAGTSNSTASGNTGDLTNNLTLGAELSGGTTNFTDLRIAELITFDVRPDSTTRTNLANNLMSWFGAV